MACWAPKDLSPQAHMILMIEFKRSSKQGLTKQALLFWLSKGGLKVSSGTINYRSSYGTDFDGSEMAGSG